MPVIRTYECDACDGTFDVFHSNRDEPPPEKCDICGSPRTGAAIPVKMSIGTTRGKIPDQVFRQMESDSIGRARDAADLLGVNESEMSDMKITNMKDKPHEGEDSVITPTTKTNLSGLTVPGNQTLPNSSITFAQVASANRVGPSPYAGAKMAGIAQTNHRDRAVAMQAMGERAMAQTRAKAVRG